MPLSFELGNNALNTTHLKTFKTLKNFRPKVLDTIYQNKPAVSITDALLSLHALVRQNADTKKCARFVCVCDFALFCAVFKRFNRLFFAQSRPLWKPGSFRAKVYHYHARCLGAILCFREVQHFRDTHSWIGVLSPFFIFLALSLWYFKKLNKRLWFLNLICY